MRKRQKKKNFKKHGVIILNDLGFVKAFKLPPPAPCEYSRTIDLSSFWPDK